MLTIISQNNYKLPPIPKDELVALPASILMNFHHYTNAFWAFANLSKLILYKQEIYKVIKEPYPWGLTFKLDDIYNQTEKLMNCINQKCSNLCLEEAIAQSFYEEVSSHKGKEKKNIFVPEKKHFNQTISDIQADLTQIQEKVKKYKQIFMATMLEVDAMDARTFKYFLMLLYTKMNYKVIPIKQKSMFYIAKDNEKFVVQGKLGKLTKSTISKYYDTSPQDCPLIIVNNENAMFEQSHVQIVGRTELQNYITENRKIIDYHYLNENFKNSVCEAIYHVLTI